MTEEQKNALINRCKNRIAFYKAAGNTGTFDADTLQLTEIALAALTAPPVKLPGISELIESSESMPNVRDVLIWDAAIKLCAEAIRSAGYQVEGE